MSTVRPESVTVLHVDDQPDFVDLSSTLLEKVDSTLAVRTTTSADDALTLLQENEIDCVVSDYDMPGKDGLEFLEFVRDQYPDLPFILFTGKGSEEIASKAISAGVSDYLQKETGTDQYTVLANRIVTLVGGYRAKHAAERTEERYHNLVDNAPVPILLFGEHKRLVYANNAAADFLNADTGEIKGREFTDFLHPDDREQAEERFGRLMSEETAVPEVTYRIRTTDGTVNEASVASAPGMYQGESVAQVIVRYQTSSAGDTSE